MPVRTLRRLLLLLIPMMLIVMLGCAHANDPPQPAADDQAQPRGPAVEVYRSTGSRQCEEGGATPEQLRAQLEAAGVRVLSTTCGSDGRMYPSVCGAPDGRIVIFGISPNQLEAATDAGFMPMAELPDAQRLECS